MNDAGRGAVPSVNMGRPWFARFVRFSSGAIVPIGIFIVWQAAYSLSLASPTLLPSAFGTLGILLRLVTSTDLAPDFGMTVFRMSVGFVLAAVVGTGLGLAMGVWRPLYDAAIPVVDFIRSTPVTVLYPVFVLVVGIADASKIAMIFAGSVFVVALNSAYGVVQANPIRRQMAALYQATPFQTFIWIVFFETLPQTMIGLRLALSYSIVVALLCEMFMGCRYGIGQRIMDAYTTYATDQMYALILIVGIFGFVLNRVFVKVEGWVVPWIVAQRQ